ncbi:hypothetical protein QQ045_007363 [Rhodiola kirilowii]
MSSTEYPHTQLAGKILFETGKTYATGLVCTSVFYFLKGTYKSPYGQRFISGTQAARMNAPWFAGACAAYSCLFDTFEGTLISLRQKEDVWNEIVAGTASYGCLDIRRGLGKASRTALIGGVLVAALRGVEFMYDLPKPKNNIVSTPKLTSIQCQGQARSAEEISQPSAACPWLGDFFHGNKKGHDK